MLGRILSGSGLAAGRSLGEPHPLGADGWRGRLRASLSETARVLPLLAILSPVGDRVRRDQRDSGCQWHRLQGWVVGDL